MLWLCLHFPSLPLEVFTRLDEHAGQQTLLVVDQHRVLCASTKAIQLGVQAGQSVATANALCDKVRVLERNPLQESKALTYLAHRCYQFTPMVSLQPPASILLEVSGSLVLFKGLPKLQQQLLQEITDLGYSACHGSGQTPGAAWLATQARLKPETPDHLPEEPCQQLAQLPLSHLDINDKQHLLLRDMGFSRLGELLALPRHTLGRRFGQEFLLYLQQVIGEHADPRQPIELTNEFNAELFYIDGLDNTQALLFPAKRLLGELSHYLRFRQLYCRSFNWQFEQLKQQTHLLTIHLSRPQNDPANFLELTRIKLEQLSLKGAVHGIALASNDFNAAVPENRSLLNPNTRADHQQDAAPPELLLDKLAARLGREQLLGITATDEHVPECAWRSTRGPATKPTVKHPKQPNPPIPASRKTRPAWLLPNPAPLQQRGRTLYWKGKQLFLLRGPERIDSHWWQVQPIRRDYFIARYEDGGLYWVYREVVGKRWFVHGAFS